MNTCAGLDHLHRELAAALHRLEIGEVERPGPQRRASRFAAATASCIARLMPTPPIGDMACAASPMARKPGLHQRVEPVDRDGQELHVVPAGDLAEPVARGTARWRRRALRKARRRRSSAAGAALPDDVGALPVARAVEHDHHAARHRHGRRSRPDRWAGARRGTTARRSARRDPRPRDPPPRAAPSAGHRRRWSASARMSPADRRAPRQRDAVLLDQPGRLGVHQQVKVRQAFARGRRGNRGSPIAASAR